MCCWAVDVLRGHPSASSFFFNFNFLFYSQSRKPVDNLDILVPSSLASNTKIYVFLCGTYWMLVRSTPAAFRKLHMAFQWGEFMLNCFTCSFWAAHHVLMNVSSNMARPDETYVTPTTDQMGNPTFPSQYWRSRLTVWAPFAVNK